MAVIRNLIVLLMVGGKCKKTIMTVLLLLEVVCVMPSRYQSARHSTNIFKRALYRTTNFLRSGDGIDLLHSTL